MQAEQGIAQDPGAGLELPTCLLAAGIYGSWLGLTWFYAALPWWVLLPAGAYVVCLHGSLQHEVLHGHPTRWQWLNELIARPALWLWLPYGIYRDSHIRHHRTQRLTCPLDDPESNYVLPERWATMGPIMRMIYTARTTLLGRMLLGPAICVASFLAAQMRMVGQGDRRAIEQWVAHLAAVVPLIFWVVVVCGMPLWVYVALFAYPGLSLALLRSYAEHRPDRDQAHATAIVEASVPLALVFLNNNLHALHHERPAMAWYRLPALYRADRAGVLQRNGGYLFKGYREQFARFLLRSKDGPVHPFYGAADAIPPHIAAKPGYDGAIPS